MLSVLHGRLAIVFVVESWHHLGAHVIIPLSKLVEDLASVIGGGLAVKERQGHPGLFLNSVHCECIGVFRR